MKENNNHSSQSSKSSNKFSQSISSLGSSNRQISNHNNLDECNNDHPEYSTTISSVSDNNNTNTASSISQSKMIYQIKIEL